MVVARHATANAEHHWAVPSDEERKCLFVAIGQEMGKEIGVCPS